MTLLSNPIYRREMLSRLRSWKTGTAVIAVALLSSTLVLLRWPADATVDLVSRGAVLIFRPLAFAMAMAVMMLVPAFPATCLVTERQAGTLALLLASPVTPWRLYVGKMMSNVVLSALMISVGLPALSACFAMGGVTWLDHIVPLLLVLLTMAVQYSAIGLWVSVRAVSTDAALRWTYGLILLGSVLSLGPHVLVGNIAGGVAHAAQRLTVLSPLPALQRLTGSTGGPTSPGWESSWQVFVLVACAISLAFSWATIRRLNPILLDRPRPTGRIVGRGAAQASWWRRLAYLVDPNKRTPGIPRWVNPIMVKEFRTRRFGRLHWLIRFVSLCAIVSLLLTVLASLGTVSWGVERIAGSLVLLQVALLLLIGPSLGANLIAAEIESGGWQILRATPISPWRVLSGKVMSVVWTMMLVLLATLPGYAVMSFIQPTLSGQVENVIISLLVAMSMVVSISACISGFMRSAATATATAYAVVLSLFAGTMVIWLARGRPFGVTLVERILLFNPAAAALSEMGTPGFEQYRLTPTAWWVGLSISGGCLVILGWRLRQLTRPD
ncbi:MAG: hypothetical protein KatS3mg111_2526 [Pirellulaceae bacterium]|nr:MAG: hypothetical protein KatS3mg111_2526 [Pirellulaceae bacterium]